jgi:mRNA interferase MazF
MEVREPSAKFSEPMQAQVWWAELDPTVGSEIQKTRPALVVSPDDLNRNLPRVIIAPLTTGGRPLGCRPEVRFNGKKSRILLDQIRAVDKSRLVRFMGTIDQRKWKSLLLEMFA